MLDDESIREVMDELKQKRIIRAAAVSMHNDVAANLDKATDLGFYDLSMITYNVGNHSRWLPRFNELLIRGWD